MLRLNHTYESLDAEKGVITFTNGTSVQHDIVVGADGVGVSDAHSIVYPIEKSQPQGPFITVFYV